eukprot:TRINITY_DN1285_c0_g1_i1.p1 TRINITY_DN1285_c0_g1~~TRINITY_DN1285_c0_g1_i1.p1  ORF type:complete len:201 (-),score=47.64 TRINITY_DN1285_c0_g1_i1:854-1432(-)
MAMTSTSNNGAIVAVATLLQSILKATDGPYSTSFDATAIPSVSLECYVDRLFQYAQCSPSCFVAALIYLDRLMNTGLVPLTKLNVHKLMLVSLVTSVKVHEDVRMTNADFAFLGGTTTAELKRIEVLFLFSVKFDLYIEPQTFNHYSKRLTAFVQQGHVPRLTSDKCGASCKSVAGAAQAPATRQPNQKQPC